MKMNLRLPMMAAATLVLAGLLTVALGVWWGSSGTSASSTGSLACSVKTSCDVDEVALFRMSSTANAHGGTPGGSGYGNVVCCGGVAGLGNSCSGTFDTVLTLSGVDNAHAASAAQYPTNVCLSADTETVDCWLGDSCGFNYSCLATLSGTTNAHVADCDGSGDYATKVCCYAGQAQAVGGTAELPAVAEGSDSRTAVCIALAGAIAAALFALTAGGWYARRRWLR
jgi:hypothetical protein